MVHVSFFGGGRWYEQVPAGSDGSDHFSMCYAPALVGGGFGPSGGHLQCDAGVQQKRCYPLVNIEKTLENRHFYLINQLFLWQFSIANCWFTRG
jgi:hypothetical protein